MGTNLTAPKKQRNYVIDVLKLVFTTCCLMAHIKSSFVGGFLGIPWFVDKAAVLNPKIHESGAYFFLYHTPVFGLQGFTTIAIFTFLGGYWLMQAFKGYQKRGLIGKGKDIEIFGKYAAKTYAAYWPYVLFGTGWGFAFWHVAIPGLRNIKVVIGNFLTTIIQFFGILGLGYDTDGGTYTMNLSDIITYTNNFTEDAARVLVKWNGPLWYMFTLIVCAIILFAMLLINEKFASFVFGPFIFALYNMSSMVPGISNYQNFALNTKWVQFMGPMMLGVWGWYIIEWLKTVEISKKGKIGLNIFTVATIFFLWYNIKTNYGGMAMCDLLAAVLGVLAFAEKDSITTGINKALSHVPGLMKFVGFAALGAYIIHMPILQWLQWANNQGSTFAWLFDPFRNWTLNQLEFFFLAFFYALCIPLYFVDKYYLKKLSAWVIKITKANEPVVIEAPKN